MSDELSPEAQELLNPSPNPASDGTDNDPTVVDETETKDVTVQAEVPVERDEPLVEGVEVDEDFVVVQTLDERRNIPGTSQYLDEVERRNAEIVRAKAEGREPDLENPPAFQGTPLITKAQAKQQGLNTDGEQVSVVTLPVVRTKEEEGQEAFVNFDAYNGAGGSLNVNSGVPTP